MITIRSDCCPCNCAPKVIASFTTNRDQPVWNLTPYQGVGMGTPCGHWRVFETSGRITYFQGEIDQEGRLVGLPNEFRSNYYYDGYMQLQEGCANEYYACSYDWDIQWP